jgi:sugar/nucleoside kinase (ribokinase family)
MAAALVDNEVSITTKPPKVDAVRVTGAGDIFMAAHIASELNGIVGLGALQFAANKAGDYVAGKLEVLNEN